jgi:hypothetical protein
VSKLIELAKKASSAIVRGLTTGWAIMVALVTLAGGSLLAELSARNLAADLLRDIGIAFLVAVLVARFYELHERGKRERERIEGVLDATMAEYVPPEIWQDTKEQFKRRKLIRKEVEIRFDLKHDKSLSGNLAIIELEFEYMLHGLGQKPVKERVQHELDYQFEEKGSNLPRFDRLLVQKGRETRLYDTPAKLQQIVKDGIVTVDVEVGGRKDPGVRILTKRLELTNVPGSYNLFMTELTKGLRLRVGRFPEDVEIDVKIRPEGNWEKVTAAGNEWTYDELMLPGTGIEIKLICPPRTKRTS